MSDLVPLRSGEAVAVRDAATDQLADALDFLKQRAREARELQDVISRELVERLAVVAVSSSIPRWPMQMT